MLIFQQVRGEIERQIALSEDNDFIHGWTRLHENFRFWLSSITTVMPPSLKFQQEVDAFLMTCDLSEDPCCLKRIRHLRDQLSRVQSVLQIHRQSTQHQSMEVNALQEEMKMTSTEWSQTQATLDQIQRELQNISDKRMRLWGQNESIKTLEELEQRQQSLEKKQSLLTQQIAPMRLAMERVRKQNTEVTKKSQLQEALDQSEEWKRKIDEQQILCENEAKVWADGRGLQYRARESAVKETLQTLDSLYTTSQQKLDGAGLALMRYGLLIIHNLIAVAASPSNAFQHRFRVAQDTLSHHIQRMALNQPSLAEILHQYNQCEEKIRSVRMMIEELQLENSITSMLQKSFTLL